MGSGQPTERGMFGTYLNPANAITGSRYFTLPAFYFYIQDGANQLATLMIVLCGVLDLFDGPVARKLKCTSGFGEMFDAVTDGLCYAFFMFVLVWFERMPLLPVLIFLVLGVFNSALRLIYAKRVGRTTNYQSFAMERVVAYTVYLTGIAVANFEVVFYSWGLVGFMVIVVIHDFKRMILDPVPA